MQNFWKFNREKIILLLIVLIGAFLRLYGLNWDQNNHLHPDERAIIMVIIPLHLPSNISEFLSADSPLNPHFFAYGSLPLYLLKAIGSLAGAFFPQAASYDQINLIGRFISVVFDVGTLILVYLLGRKLFSKTVGLLGAFFYAISVFPIQAAHFYAVDTPLTFFILLTLYALINFYEKPNIKRSIWVGILLGASLATKTSALVLIASIGIALISDFILIFIGNPHQPRIWFPHVPKLIKRLFTDGFIILISTLISFLIFEPYAILDFKEFWQQTIQQSQMTHDAFTFPYTLQYVGKIPYLYEIKNIFLWGQGPILATISFLGIFYTAFIIFKKKKEKKWAQEFILLIFLLSYFAVVGKFAVGWMRYMLPLYPLLCLFGAVIAYKLFIVLKSKFRYWKFVVLVFIGGILIWPLSFINIYTQPNTRILASNWIYQNIPQGSTLAIEHWDDQIPFGQPIQYNFLTLPEYDADSQSKWIGINETLKKTDYIIIASNRLYVPLQKLTDCEKLKPHPCYKETADYYKKLFSGELGFQKIAEFSVLPKIPLTNIQINDESADESFTVFDHPKIMIFKKRI